MKRAFTATATGLALLAGGVTMATPAMADDSGWYPCTSTPKCVNYQAWSGNMGIDVNTRNFEWSPQLRYSFNGAGIVNAPCPGGWGPNQNTHNQFQQICQFSTATDDTKQAYDRGVTITIAGGSVVTDPSTGNHRTFDGASIAMPSQAENDFRAGYLFWLQDPPSSIPPGIGAGLQKTDNSAEFLGNYVLSLAIDDGFVSSQAAVANESPVGAAVNVDSEAALTTRSKTLTTSDHRVSAKHQTRVEKMANKVHNKGGVLTIHAYGPDEDLALSRARAVRAHLEAQLAKRGHTESSPIWVTYAGNPAHKKNTQVTVHWHPDTNLPGALPGAK